MVRNMQRLQEIVDFVRSNPVPNLDFSTWKSESPCRTTHCILGWCAENGVADLSLQPTASRHCSNQFSLILDAGKTAMPEIQEFLGFAKGSNRASYWDTYNWLFSETVTQEIALDRIQSFIDWGHYGVHDYENDREYQLYQLEGLAMNFNLLDFYQQVQNLPFSLCGIGYSVSTHEFRHTFAEEFMGGADRYCITAGRSYLELQTYVGAKFINSYNLIRGV